MHTPQSHIESFFDEATGTVSYVLHLIVAVGALVPGAQISPVLLIVALAAAYVAAQKPADILFLMSAAFSIAAAAFFPALVLGIFWKRATGIAASVGMVAGLGVTFYYMVTTQPWLYKLTHGTAITPEIVKANTWWDIAPISAGIFGVPVGFAVIIIVSLLTKEPAKEVQELVENVRFPSFDGTTSQGTAAH